MIESVELVVAALAAGAAAGADNAPSAAVRDAYEGLKSLTRKALRRGDEVESGVGMEAALTDPSGHHAELVEALSQAGVDESSELAAMARRLLDLVDPQSAGAGKYRVVLNDNKGCAGRRRQRADQHLRRRLSRVHVPIT